MKHGAMFVNTSRGGLVDSGALERAVREKGLRVALDVYAGEPEAAAGEFKSSLFDVDAFVGTHHVGASTEQAQNAIAAEAVRICREFMTSGRAPNSVNVERQTPAKVQLIVRHYDKVGVLAAVLDVVRRHEVNVEEMTNTIFAGARAAVAVIRLSAEPPDTMIDEIATMRDRVIHVAAKPC
jgi:D-3-phosphoglycerate dehydrogenase